MGAVGHRTEGGSEAVEGPQEGQAMSIEQGASVPAERLLGKPVMDWQEAALRLGEELAGVGPDGYYGFTPAQWFKWALGVASERARGGCVCTIDDGLVREWVQKARAVAKMKGFTVPPLPAPPASSDGGTQG
jgi:hypothetical protein